MSHKPLIINSVLVLAALVALSAPAFGAENATITGDKVNAREQPSVWRRIIQTFDKGERVEVTAKTDFSDTINGFTAPWYELSGADGYGYVFGKYVELDPGIAVPPLDSNEPYSDPMYRFIRQGLDMFGGTESAIIKTLGRPVSRTEEKWKSSHVEGKYTFDRRLTYRGVALTVFESEDSWEYVYELSLTTDAYAVCGLTVGSSVADVEGVLGPPSKIEEGSLIYYTRYYGDIINIRALFKTKDAVVVEIVFEEWFD